MRSSGPSLTAADLAAAEEHMECLIPPALRAFYAEQNGGAPDRPYFVVGGSSVWFSWMFPVTPVSGSDDSGLQAIYREMTADQMLPVRHLPFGTDPGGNFVLLDVDTDRVWYMPMDVWESEESAEENWARSGRTLASGFEAFLDGLREEVQF